MTENGDPLRGYGVDPLRGLDPELIRVTLAQAYDDLGNDDMAERLAAVESGAAPPGTYMHREGDFLVFTFGNRELCRRPLASLLARQPDMS